MSLVTSSGFGPGAIPCTVSKLSETPYISSNSKYIASASMVPFPKDSLSKSTRLAVETHRTQIVCILVGLANQSQPQNQLFSPYSIFGVLFTDPTI